MAINNLADIFLDENQIEHAISFSLTAITIEPENKTFIKTFKEIKQEFRG
jgi:cysteine sulfinate desulfinase/cysteine desulfurase-like protein